LLVQGMRQFSSLARSVAQQLGRPAAFAIACLAVILWALAGPLFGYSDTWQLVINTSTTIVTFLMVFVIQNTQNRDTTQGAHNAILDLEQLDEQQLGQYLAKYEALAAAARAKLAAGKLDTGAPEIKTPAF
jgi:low affinity Fe/Cu permease